VSTPALLTDHYELTMVQAARHSGAADRRCVFEVFARSLPGRRRYGVLAGVGRLLEALPHLRFDEDALDFLASAGVVDGDTCEWLSSYRFNGSIDGYAEGETYFPHSPVLVVEGTFAECTVLETLVLSVLNHDTAVATAAARMVCAAGDRPCIEMGSRRTHEDAAVASARAAYIAGFASTSNLAAGSRWGIPTTGTAAHSFTLLHDDERQAFTAQVEALGADTTLLVDTYDVDAGIRTAVEVAGPALGAIRLDSGDLPSQARMARALLDDLGATNTRIVVTSDLDEHSIAALAAAPVDGYGVGTSLVTGSGVPTAGFVYKLVARCNDDDQLVAVQKKSVGKGSIGGRKWATRSYAGGVAGGERVYVDHMPSVRDDERPLMTAYVRHGEVLEVPSLAEAREHCRRSRGELPQEAMKLSAGDPALDVDYVTG
jgi:nicotinate phosphoribosyltransferase